MNHVLFWTVALGILSTNEASAYVVADRCFPGSRIEDIRTSPAHDDRPKTGRHLYVGVDLEAIGASGAVVYVKVKPESVFAKVIEIAAARDKTFTPCFSEPVARELKKALKDSKNPPRYEHQVAVELIDASFP